MARKLGGELMTLVGPTATLAVKDPFSGKVLRKAIPDLTERVTRAVRPGASAVGRARRVSAKPGRRRRHPLRAAVVVTR